MVISSDPKDGAGNEALLLDTVETLLQMAKIVRISETNEEVRLFYSHLSLHCLRLNDHLTRARQASSFLNADLVAQALGHLDSLVPESDLQELPAYPAKPEFRLKMLCRSWDEIGSRRHDAKLDFIHQCLRPGRSEEQRHKVEALKSCADELDRQQPEQPGLKHSQKYTSTEINEPPYAVCKAAKSIYDALVNCKGCSCPDPHDFKAKLRLGTYRSPPKKPVIKSTRRRIRKGRGDDDAGGGLELDMFLTMERDWHEFRVQTVKDKVVRFGGQVDDGPAACGKRIVEQYARVERLCRPIIKTKTKALQRLILRLNSGQLFEIGFEKSNFQIDHAAEPISLAQCFEDRRDFFTEKTKRILSLIIGYTVLHLHGTSWLQPGWGSSNIKFFQTTSCKTPLRPFIEAQLPKTGPQIPGYPSIENDVGEDDDLDSGHCCPEVVALAVVLMEVYFVKPFKKLAAMHEIKLIETPSGRITLMDVDQVFDGVEGSTDGVEGWRSQIPEDSPLLEAIDNCLNSELWEDDEGQPLDSATLRSQLYQKVVRPLEDDLTNGFRTINLDDVDQYAKNLDFGNWGQPSSIQEPHGGTALLSPQGVMPIRSPSPSHGVFALLSPGQFALAADGWRHMRQSSRLHSLVSFSGSDVDSMSNSDFDYRALQFFDDEVGDGEHSAVETGKYIRWRAEYSKVYKKFITSYLRGPPSQPVKIAVLDTGYDRDHVFFEALEDNIKGKKNCYNETQKNVPDTHGHGTFTASLILEYAPDASLYVIKIADKKNTRPDAKIVANAINHAVDKWDVDIISMSFGWPSSDFDGYDELQAALDKAISRKVLMFAAAANSGGRLGRAYPASSSQVICVHSTNTNGNRSDFSPTAEPNAINIATVGESVQAAWPTLLCQDEMGVKSRSGTSYATPIVAGMAAFLLQFARLHLGEGQALALKRREKMEALLRRCAVRGARYQPRDEYFFVHLSLDKHNLFGGELDGIKYEILGALRT